MTLWEQLNEIEQEQPTTLYGHITYGIDDEYDRILNSNMPKEQKAEEIQRLGEAQRNYLDNELNKDLAKQYIGAGLEIASAGIPLGATAKISSSLAKPLVSQVGKKIAQEIASGATSGVISGGVFGAGRGLMENENPLKTSLQDAVTGGVLGGSLGYGTGELLKHIDIKNALKNAKKGVNTNVNDLIDNYYAGLSNQDKALNDVRQIQIQYPNNKYNTETQYLFAGENALNIPKGKLREAEQMEMYGESNADIRNATGFFRGVDGKWRYEIPDGKLIDDINWTKNIVDGETIYVAPLNQVYDSPELYKNYPQFNDIWVTRKNLPNTTEAQSDLYNDLINLDNYTNYINYAKYPNKPLQQIESWTPQAEENIPHELQHFIQYIEDFAQGGNSKNSNYHNLAGEVESRLASARRNLTPEQRQIYNPANESSYLTNYGYDVLPEKQIIEFNNDRPNFSIDNLTQQKQLDLIKKYNPAPNEYQTWIRGVEDIKNPYNLFNTNNPDLIENPDWKLADMQKVLKNGKIKVYSSHPIEKGIFITPSKIEAKSYSGNGEIFEKEIPLEHVAWIDSIEGQYTPLD